MENANSRDFVEAGGAEQTRTAVSDRTWEEHKILETGVYRLVSSITPSDKKWLYFIERGEGGPVKIGVARDPLKRLKALQSANAEPLRILCAVPEAERMEGRVHRALADGRLEGEWFEHGMVLRFLKSLEVAALARVKREAA